MTHLDPLNIGIMDVDKLIKERGLLEVTSTYIHSPSSSDFHPEGLYSETIFGAIGTPARFTRHGYITLNCRVFHPTILQNLQTLKRFYMEIMSGTSYAKWDNELQDFVAASEEEEGANTGYAFFLKYFPKIDFKKNKSLKRNDKINVLLKYKDNLFITKCIVVPAGIRDIKEEDGRVEKDSINSLYASLLNSVRAMPTHGDMDPIYDVIHWSIQRKVLEIYTYLLNMVEGKRGFLQGKLGHRSIVGSSRNVITSTSLEASDPSSPQYHKCDETKVPLYQTIKSFSSLMLFQLKSLFYSSIISQTSDNIPLIDPLTYKLVYVPIDAKDKDSLVTEEGINKTLDRFRDPDHRMRPVIAKSGGKPYYLYLIYDDGDHVFIFRNLEEFKGTYEGTYDEKKLRPLTNAEMMYVAAYFATYGKSVLVTRYPVTDEQSIYPSKIHIMTTSPARIVTMVANNGEGVQLPEWPNLDKKFVDAVMLHPTKLQGLGADFDGDTISIHPIYSDEANKEIDEALNSAANYAFPGGGPVSGIDDLCKITMRALTADTPELK